MKENNEAPAAQGGSSVSESQSPLGTKGGQQSRGLCGPVQEQGLNGDQGSSGRSQTREAGEPGCSAGLNVRPQNRNQYASQPRKILALRKPHWGSGAARVQAHLQEAALALGHAGSSASSFSLCLPAASFYPPTSRCQVLGLYTLPSCPGRRRPALVSFHHPWSILSLLTPDFLAVL